MSAATKAKATTRAPAQPLVRLSQIPSTGNLTDRRLKVATDAHASAQKRREDASSELTRRQQSLSDAHNIRRRSMLGLAPSSGVDFEALERAVAEQTRIYEDAAAAEAQTAADLAAAREGAPSESECKAMTEDLADELAGIVECARELLERATRTERKRFESSMKLTVPTGLDSLRGPLEHVAAAGRQALLATDHPLIRLDKWRD